MSRWKLIQEFNALPPQKQIRSLLLIAVCVLFSSIGAIVSHYEDKMNVQQVVFQNKEKYYQFQIRVKDSQNVADHKDQIEFMQKEIMIRYEFKNEIDSLKSIKKLQ
jgi:Na+/H+ antiporter NhaB